MKRSSAAASSLENGNEKSKKLKTNEEFSMQYTPDTREYLQLALARIVELERQIDQGIYDRNETNNLGLEEDVMKEVLTRVFQELPGTSTALTTIINSTSKPTFTQVKTTRNKAVQLSGFECCRQIAVNFLKNSAHSTPREATSTDFQRRYVGPMEIEATKRISDCLDLHLAVKQRDYTARLMRE